MSWEAHRESVTMAMTQLADVQQEITRLIESSEQALTMVLVAIGSGSNNERGLTSFRRAGDTTRALQQALAAVNEAHNALTDYRQSF